MANQKSKQWNLNQTIGWKSIDPHELSEIYTRLNQLDSSSGKKDDKRKFDEAVLKELKSKRCGDLAEGDSPNESDYHFLVSSDFQNALTIIISVARSLGIDQQITIYKRDYKSYDTWKDHVIYPMK